MITKRRYRKELIEALLVTIAAAILLRFFVVGIYKVSSNSMLPSLVVGDTVAAFILPYGVRNPVNGALLVSGSRPERGTIVVLSDPEHPQYVVVRRMIAQSGDKVQIRDSELIINDQPARVHLDGSRLPMIDYPFASQNELVSETINNHNYWTYLRLSEPGVNISPVIVPTGSVFVLPDYRTFSGGEGLIGLVPESSVRGRVALVLFSLNFDKLVGPFPKLRFDRLFRLTH